MSIRLYIANNIIGLLPPTKFYRFKARLFSWCGFEIHKNARIVSLRIYGSLKLSIGNDTYIGQEVIVAGGTCSINIGEYCDIGPRSSLLAGTHEIDMIGSHSAGAGLSKDIIIEDGVWICANVSILGGVRIGRKAVIAAGSVVTQDIPPYVIAAGVPCRPVKKWHSESQKWRAVEIED